MRQRVDKERQSRKSYLKFSYILKEICIRLCVRKIISRLKKEHTQVVGLQFVLEGLVSGLGKEGLLLKDGKDAHRLLEEVDAGLQVHAEVDHGPLDAWLILSLNGSK